MSTDNNNITNTYYSQNFELINEELRKHFKLMNKEVDKIKDKVNELVIIIHNDNKKWSLSQICKYIAGKNDDLEELGFSAKTIERYLTAENKKMLTDSRFDHTKGSTKNDKKDDKKNGTNSQNKVIEDEEDNCPPHVPEHSSSTSSSSSSDNNNSDSNTTTSSTSEHEDLSKYDQDLQGRVWILEQRITHLEEDRKELEKPYDIEQIIQIKDQDLPFIIHVEPYDKKAWIELDQIKVKKLGLNKKK